ncbi:hypothetical protein HN859_00230, partial [Candidatus Parcubacteria bacterium]|nr:hypothetical protein [Candidatus Parcubacteria bacterium]
MILERVQHHLMITFVIALSLMYGLVFVATRAQIIDPPQLPQLSATYIDPVQGVDIPGGTVLNIQANIGPNQGFTHAHFTLLGTITNLEFPAELQSDGSWKAISSWDTADFPAGDYYLKVTAQIFDNNGLLSDEIESPLESFVLLASRNQDPQQYDIGGDTTFLNPLTDMEITDDTMDIIFEFEGTEYLNNIFFDIHEVDNNGIIVVPALVEDIHGQQLDLVYGTWGVRDYDISSLADGEYQIIMQADLDGSSGEEGPTSAISNYVRFSIVPPAVDIPEIVPLEIVSVISPTETDLSGEVLLAFEINRPLGDNIKLTAKIFNVFDYYVGSVDLFSSDADGVLMYSGYWDTTVARADGTPLYQNSTYSVKIYEEINGISLDEPLFVLESYAVSNLTEQPEVEEVVIIAPVPGSDLISNGIIPIDIEIELDFIATDVGIEFVYQDDAAIAGGGVLAQVQPDSYIWGGGIILDFWDDIFPSGNYDLIFEITKEDGTIYELEGGGLPTYGYNLIVAETEDPDLPPPPPDDVVLNFHNTESFMEGDVTLMGSSNVDLNNQMVYFVFENQADESKYYFSADLADWSQLEGYGINRDNFPDADYAYAKDPA